VTWARDVLRHRIVLSYEALAEEMDAEGLLSPILDAVPLPAVPLRENSPSGRERPLTAGEPTWTRPQP
jgi:MoxR-like ATPase